MGANSNIEWTDHTFNPWRGCTKVSEGCAHCYAETLSRRNPRLLGEWGRGKPRVLASEGMWGEPLKWNKESGLAWENWTRAVDARAGYSGEMPASPRVFCASLADWLDDEVPIEWLARLLRLIHDTPHLDWLLLTKRPQNFFKRLETAWKTGVCAASQPFLDWLRNWGMEGKAPANVWIGTSVENQARAEERVPLLLNIPARVRFLSCEPLLGAVSLSPYLRVSLSPLHWVICGGESGPRARPMHPDWARGLRDQCEAAGVPFFFKQWGEWCLAGQVPTCAPESSPWHRGVLPTTQVGDQTFYRAGKKAAGARLDGRAWREMPAIKPSLSDAAQGVPTR